MGCGRDAEIFMDTQYVQYKRSKFSTRLPSDRLYTTSHAWLKEDQTGLWCVGFTKFATRILGEPVEFDVELDKQAPVQAGDVIGWIEGFKAVTDLFCPLDGVFEWINAELNDEITLVQSDTYGRGWLYSVRGTPPSDCLDVEGYVAVLDGTIDKMMGKTG